MLRQIMTIRTSTFGHIELSGQDAARFIRHMHEDKPNPAAQAALARGQILLREILVAKPTRSLK
jgi:hypothetical protein